MSSSMNSAFHTTVSVVVLLVYMAVIDVLMSEFIATLWYKLESAFAFTHDVYIIGLSLTPDDFFIRSWFLSNLPYLDSYTGLGDRHIYVINSDPEIEKNYDFNLSKGNINFLKEPFSDEHIRLIEDRLQKNS